MSRDRLVTSRFLIMCAYTFTVFVSLFQLLPTAPYHVIDLGGGTVAAGLFLGFLTFASALSAPFTGAIGDRIGQRHVLMAVSVVLAIFTASYSVIRDYRLLLGVVIVHGLFWSALLSASGAYMTSTIPASRRAEGLGYWGMASIFAIGAAPAMGFWVYRFGWAALCWELTTLNVLMAVIAWRLPDDLHGAHGHEPQAGPVAHQAIHRIEWRVLLLSVALAMTSFGYGGLTSFSALYADYLRISPRSLFLTIMAVSMLAARILLSRSIDRIGHRRVLMNCLVVPGIGLALLAVTNGPVLFGTAAAIFGAGFGLMNPSFTAYVMTHVSFARRGAAFGAMIAAFDTGIGAGSSVMGWVVDHVGFRQAFGATAVLAAVALPLFLFLERRLGFAQRGTGLFSTGDPKN
ncbi:MAG TPA: MFS transporter [Vicinamibacterales bacterium]|nr:MFS transporter [Vicinamibacterales bacterium]